MSLLDKASIIITPNGVKATKLYAYKPDNGNGDMTWTCGAGTRRNVVGLLESMAANTPRINYPINGGCPVILLEPQRTNLLTYSEDFNGAIWNNFRSSDSYGTTISPDGSVNATSLIEDSTASATHVIRGNVAKSAVSLKYTVSIYVKANTRSKINLNLQSGSISNRSFATFDLLSGTVSNETNQGTFSEGSASMVDEGNGWYRCIISALSDTDTQINTRIELNDGSGVSYNGDGVSSVYIWGAQLEQRDYPTTYKPANGSTVTRLKDVGDRDDIYTNGLLTAIGGSWLVELTDNTVKTRDAVGGGLTLDTNTGGKTNGLEISNTNGTDRFSLSKYIATVLTTLYTTTDDCKVLFNWDGVLLDIYENGVLVVTAEPFTITAMEFLQLNCIDQTYSIKQNIIGEPLTNSEAIQISTI